MKDFRLGSTFNLKFNTRRFTTGAPHTLADSPSMMVYEDASGTEITSGLTLSLNFDSKTGLNNVEIVATAANGFEADKIYTLAIAAGTVDSVVVVGEIVGEFSLDKMARLMGILHSGTLVAAASGSAMTLASDAPTTSLGGMFLRPTGGTGGRQPGRTIISHNTGTDEIVVNPALSTTPDNTTTYDILESAPAITDPGSMPTVLVDAADILTKLGLTTPNLNVQFAAVIADTENLQSRTPAALVTGRMDASVGAMANDTLTEAAVATSAVAEIQSGLATASALETVGNYLDTEMAAVLAAVDTEVAAIKAKTDNLPIDPADASVVAGLIAALQTYVDTEVAAILAAVDTEVAAIKAKTDQLTFSTANVVDANAARINNKDIAGDGSSGDKIRAVP